MEQNKREELTSSDWYSIMLFLAIANGMVKISQKKYWKIFNYAMAKERELSAIENPNLLSEKEE